MASMKRSDAVTVRSFQNTQVMTLGLDIFLLFFLKMASLVRQGGMLHNSERAAINFQIF